MCWMPVKQCLEGSWAALNACFRKKDSFQINNLRFYPRNWAGEKKEDKLNPKQKKKKRK